MFDTHGSYRTVLDGNARARVMAHAEVLERRTKAKGKRDGVLGQSGVTVLRALVFGFLDARTGRLDPSYKAIQRRTGFCMATIAKALKALSRAGILVITRRMVRIGGFVRQTSSAYQLRDPQSTRLTPGCDSRMQRATTSTSIKDVDPDSPLERALARLGRAGGFAVGIG